LAGRGFVFSASRPLQRWIGRGRPVYDRTNPTAARPPGFRWDQWRTSGGDRFQGGTIAGITSKLDYIKGLGTTTIWVGPIFKQRGHLDTYHGYSIQDFADVEAEGRG
jgi:glycosidase